MISSSGLEDGHEVNVEMLFRMGRTALGRNTHKDITIEHHLMANPIDGVSIDWELATILLYFDWHKLGEEVEEVVVLDLITHLGLGVVFDFLLIVHSAFHAKMKLLVGVVLLKILPNGNFNNLACSSTHLIYQQLATEACPI